VFNDQILMAFPDPDHSDDEQRYVNIGHSSKGRTLVVVHTERETNIRITGCRKATTSEQRAHETEDI